jgi:hypothetical protein
VHSPVDGLRSRDPYLRRYASSTEVDRTCCRQAPKDHGGGRASVSAVRFRRHVRDGHFYGFDAALYGIEAGRFADAS